MLPDAAEGIEPGVDLEKRPGLNQIDAASAFIANARKAVLAEHTQVLRDGGLRGPELALDDDDDISGCELTTGQQLENTATDGITEDVLIVSQA